MGRPEDHFHGFMHGRVWQLRERTSCELKEINGAWVPSAWLDKGTRVKVVMVSRFGDVGITTDLAAENGYSGRVWPWQLEPSYQENYTGLHELLKPRLESVREEVQAQQTAMKTSDKDPDSCEYFEKLLAHMEWLLKEVHPTWNTNPLKEQAE